MGIRRLAFVPPYSVFCSISFRCGWVKYRAQPEAISTWNHAGRNAPWQAETGWGEKVKPRKPAWNQAFLWLPICGCQVRNKNFCKKSPTRLSIGSYTNLSLVGLIFLFIIRVLTWLQMVLFQHTPIAWTEIHRSHVQHFYGRRPFTRVWNSCSVSTKW